MMKNDRKIKKNNEKHEKNEKKMKKLGENCNFSFFGKLQFFLGFFFIFFIIFFIMFASSGKFDEK